MNSIPWLCQVFIPYRNSKLTRVLQAGHGCFNGWLTWAEVERGRFAPVIRVICHGVEINVILWGIPGWERFDDYDGGLDEGFQKQKRQQHNSLWLFSYLPIDSMCKQDQHNSYKNPLTEVTWSHLNSLEFTWIHSESKAALSPSKTNADESLSTLNYAKPETSDGAQTVRLPCFAIRFWWFWHFWSFWDSAQRPSARRLTSQFSLP